jgi:hypothetical protein
MKFTVIWQPSAEEDLVRIWNAASDRQAVADAADQVDNLLASSPQTAGESRETISESYLFRLWPSPSICLTTTAKSSCEASGDLNNTDGQISADITSDVTAVSRTCGPCRPG